MPGTCFEILGADVMLEYAGSPRRLVPRLLEVNVGPVLDIRPGQDCVSTAVHKEVVSASMQAFLLNRRVARFGQLSNSKSLSSLPHNTEATLLLEVGDKLQSLWGTTDVCNAGHSSLFAFLDNDGDLRSVDGDTQDQCWSLLDLEAILTAHADEEFLKDGVTVTEEGPARVIHFQVSCDLCWSGCVVDVFCCS